MGKKTNANPLPRAAWDFSKCPNAELSFCVTYEYFRQLALVHRKRVGKKWSPRAFEEIFNGYFKEGERIEFKGTTDGQVADPFEINLSVKKTFAYAACKCTGFPDVPYLSLKAEERAAWINVLGLDKLRPDRPTMAQADFFEISHKPREALMLYQYHCAEWVRQNLYDESAVVKKDTRWIVDYDGFKFELGVIRLNWSLSDKKLVNGFEKWVQKNRPRGFKALETRGSTQMSEMLKYLSALRLLAVMTVSEAAKLTQDLFGKPFYWDDDNWYAASAKAKVVMKQISLPFFDWA